MFYILNPLFISGRSYENPETIRALPAVSAGSALGMLMAAVLTVLQRVR